MYSIKRVLAAAVFAVLCTGVAVAAQSESGIHNPSATVAAQDALRELSTSLNDQKGTLPSGFPFDVADVQDLERAVIGYGYEEFHADPQMLLSGKSLEDSAQPTGIWRYLVTVDGHAVGLLTLALQENRWTNVSMGGTQLAREIENIVISREKGTTLRFIRVLQAASDFIEVKNSDRIARFSPLGGARQSLGLDRSVMVPDTGLLDETEFGQQLRDTIARNLNN